MVLLRNDHHWKEGEEVKYKRSKVEVVAGRKVVSRGHQRTEGGEVGSEWSKAIPGRL